MSGMAVGSGAASGQWPGRRVSSSRSDGWAAVVNELIWLGEHRVRVQVRGTGRPLLLLAGAGAPLEFWEPLRQALPGVRTIALDFPGSGRSPAPRLPMSMAEHGQLVVRLLTVLGHARVSVLGFSFGGMVAQEVARQRPGLLDRLILASTTCGWGGVPEQLTALYALADADRYPSVPAVPENAGRPVREAAAAASRRARFYQSWAAAGWSSALWLGRVRAPTLVLAGADDSVTPPVNAHILALLLTNSVLRIVPGGHLAPVERVGSVAPLLRRFLLAETPPGGPPGSPVARPPARPGHPAQPVHPVHPAARTLARSRPPRNLTPDLTHRPVPPV